MFKRFIFVFCVIWLILSIIVSSIAICTHLYFYSYETEIGYEKIDNIQDSLNQIQLSIDTICNRIDNIEDEIRKNDISFNELVIDLEKDIKDYKEEIKNNEIIIDELQSEIEDLNTYNKGDQITYNDSKYEAISDTITVGESIILTEDEIVMIAKLTIAEAGNQSNIGKRLVIDTVLNRVDSPYFPNTVEEVIYQKYQFSPVWNGGIDKYDPSNDILNLVREEANKRTNYDVIFFASNGYSPYGVPLFQVEDHYFSKYE